MLYESILRSSFIALLAVLAGTLFFRIVSKKPYTVSWVLTPLFLCFFIPPVAMAYGYSNISFKLIQRPFLLQSLYVLIMVCRLTAPVTIFLFFIPGSLTPEGLHCYRLLTKFGFKNDFLKSKFIFLMKGIVWRYLIAFILVYMLAFSEFELASLMNIDHWSVSVFDSYSQGISNIGALRLHFVPFLIQFLLIVLFLFTVPSLTKCELPALSYSNFNSKGFFSSLKSFKSIICLILICLYLVIGVFLPLFMIIKSAVPGFSILLSEFWMIKELAASLIFALSATIMGYLISFLISLILEKGKFKILFLIVFIPVLIGILPVSLIILSLFQLPVFRACYGTPLPLLIALTVWILPFIVVLQLIHKTFSLNPSIHSSRLLLPFSSNNGMKLLWKFKFRGNFWIFFFVFSMAYFDLTASAILSPSSMTTITARFYNLMHYGQSEKLSATVCLSIIVPLLLFLVFGLILKEIIKRWSSFSRNG